MKIAIVIEVYKHWLFFERFEDAFKALDVDVAVFTPMASVWLAARKSFRAFLCTNVKAEREIYSEHDLKSGRLGPFQSCKLYNNVYSKLNSVSSGQEIEQIWLWNGLSSASLAGNDFAKENEISRRFFEIANIPEKVFVDCEGVNLRSSLYGKPEKLDYPADLEKYRAWREKYFSRKLSEFSIPQDFSNKKIYWVQWVDLIFSVFGLSQLSSRVNLLETFAINKKFSDFEFDRMPENDSFIFFPLQVSTDTQLTINSNIDNFDAIKILSRRAREAGLKLCVKPHPAERNFKFNAEVLDFARKEGALVLDGNTFLIIKAAREVVVINSTVGLESLIVGKPTQFLGDSFFYHFKSESFIANYVNDYLVDIDFFDSSSVQASALIAILNIGCLD